MSIAFAIMASLFAPGGALAGVNDVLAPAELGAASTYVPLDPTRIVDTRSGFGAVTGPMAHETTIDFAVRGVVGVPADAVSVVLNVTAVDAVTAGYFSLFPTGTSRPRSSSLNVKAGQNVANLVIARIGDSGRVSLFNFGGSAHAVIDVAGYFRPGTSAGRFYGTVPGRAFDSRTSGVPLGPGRTFTVPISNTSLAESHWSAVLVNITATNPSEDGYLTLFPSGSPVPGSSTVNFKAGQTVANAAIVKVGEFNNRVAISLFNFAGATDFIVDVMGIFDDGSLATGFTVPSAYYALDQPERVYDTRETIAFAAGESRPVDVSGAGGAPAGALGVMMNVTATNTTEASFLTVWPPPITRPNVSSVNWRAGDTVPNFVGVFIASGGTSPGVVTLFNNAGSVDVILDIAGYFYRVN